MRARAFACALALALIGCSERPFDYASSGRFAQGDTARRASGSQTIAHVVIVVQENRSFDDLFATFPGADGTAGGYMQNPSGSGDIYVPLQKVDLVEPCDWGHSYHIVPVDYDGGKMDGFGEEGASKKCTGKAGARVYQYVNPSQIAPYWTMASQYVLGDHMFQTQGSGSFTAHQDLIAGATLINQPKDTKSLVDFPSHSPWGCDAPHGTVTSLLVVKGSALKDEYHQGPFPCLKYLTMRDLLDAHSVSWKYYSPPEPDGTGSLWDAFDAIKAVREGPEWHTNVAKTNQFSQGRFEGSAPRGFVDRSRRRKLRPPGTELG